MRWKQQSEATKIYNKNNKNILLTTQFEHARQMTLIASSALLVFDIAKDTFLMVLSTMRARLVSFWQYKTNWWWINAVVNTSKPTFTAERFDSGWRCGVDDTHETFCWTSMAFYWWTHYQRIGKSWSELTAVFKMMESDIHDNGNSRWHAEEAGCKTDAME